MIDDELVTVDGLYAYVDVEAYWRYILPRADVKRNDMFSPDIPVRVRTFYPATQYDPTWIGITTPGGTITSFPVDLIARFTNVKPSWVRD